MSYTNNTPVKTVTKKTKDTPDAKAVMSDAELRAEKTKLIDLLKSKNPPKTAKESYYKRFKFWENQPVPQIPNFKKIEVVKYSNRGVTKDGPIVSNVDIDKVSKESITLPSNFEWCDFNLMTEFQQTQPYDNVLKFLNRFYFEDPTSKFMDNFTIDRLKWILGKTESSIHNQHICFGVVNNKNIVVGFIAGNIQQTQIKQNKVDILKVSLLCVHPSYRTKRLTPVLIKEITRRANLKGCFQGIFSTERYVPKPFSSLKVHHRPLNIQKLIESNFTKLTGKIEMEELLKKYRLPKKTHNKNFIRLEKDSEHIEQACDLLNRYLDKFAIHPIFSKEEFATKFIGDSFKKQIQEIPQVVSYVLVDEKLNQVVDFISYYNTTMRSITNKDKQTEINVGTLYYYTSTSETAYRLVNDMLIVAKADGVDLFNATDALENNTFLKELKFEEGPTTINCNLYNWNILDVDPDQVAFNF